jgi:hypothetical protein
MSNPIKYIKNLEAAGFERVQAEAQVQMVLDAIEGDLVTKSDLSVLKEQMDSRFLQVHSEIRTQVKESELRLLTRLGFMMISTVSIAVAALTWLIKI